MKTIEYKVLENELTPVEVAVGEYKTPVWIQQRIDGVENKSQLNYSGCGHCSVSMALNLRGIKVSPWEEYKRCLELFGEPSVSQSGNKQYPFLSVTGMVKVLSSYGINAEAFGVENGDRKKAVSHMLSEIKSGSIINFVSCPDKDFPENPFSKGHHWVVIAGFLGDGKIVVLNSSLNGDYSSSVLGINLVTEKEIEMALSKTACPTDKTWGEMENLDSEGTGYVVIK
ncbi:MAG: C39 family peptidase [Clostridia bacterium]|nr:C39 family peptidase [Clostridia bacterium]